MPNKTLVEILKRSVEEFNRWRYENPKEKIDLIGANLNGEHLNMANLENASLVYADLIEARLIEANLTGARLVEANLRYARLIGADLRHANLIETSLLNADLREANLTGAKVSLSQLESAIGVTQEQIDSVNLIGQGDEPVEPPALSIEKAAEKRVIYEAVKVQIDHADYLIQMADTIRKRGAVNLTEEQDKALNDLLEIIKGLQEKVKDLEAERDELKSRLPDQWRSKLPDIAAAFPKGGLFAAGQETVERITDSEIVQELLSKATESLQEVFSSWLM